jgi:hypothetical protein
MKPTELTLGQSLERVSYKPKFADHRINLKVPFEDKDKAKSIGAKWDKTLKTWYIEADVDMNKFRYWLPSQEKLLMLKD